MLKHVTERKEMRRRSGYHILINWRIPENNQDSYGTNGTVWLNKVIHSCTFKLREIAMKHMLLLSVFLRDKLEG
ncbi:hypothetical protein ACIQZD_23750 [Peribacillus sp. NPDC096447]|uniref:hypothetical protein n=1 Tax=Peribacillus sp. NPDC096447 TaxID=3364394 RepID=UPI003804C799